MNWFAITGNILITEDLLRHTTPPVDLREVWG